MKNNLLLIAALVCAGAISAAQHSNVQPSGQAAQGLVPIMCIDGKIFIQESTLQMFQFFAGMADSYDCSLSELELTPTPDKDYSLVCFVKGVPSWKVRSKTNQLGWSSIASVNQQFHMNATKAVMQFLVDFIETPQELLEEQWQGLQKSIQCLSYQELASVILIADQLLLTEPYLTNLEKLLIPIFNNLEFIQAFLHDKSVQEIVYACERIHWKDLTSYCVIKDSIKKIIFAPNCRIITERVDDIGHPTNSYKKALYRISDDMTTATIFKTTKEEDLCSSNDRDSVLSLVFSPDRKLIATGKGDFTAKITCIESGKTVQTINHSDWITSLSFSSDGKYLATGSCDGITKVTTIATGEISSVNQHTSMIQSVAVSTNGKYLAIGSHDNTVKITEMTTLETLYTIQHTGKVECVTFSPDERHLATGSFGKTVKIIELKNGNTKTIAFINDDNDIFSIAFSPDGKYLSINKYYIPLPLFDTYSPTQSTLIESLKKNKKSLWSLYSLPSFKKLSPEMQQLLLTLPTDLQAELVTAIPQEITRMHQASFDQASDNQVDDNPIPFKHRCPSGEHDTRQGCCGCTYYDDIDK